MDQQKNDGGYPWTLAVGAWGDVLCAYGNIKKLIEGRHDKANVVYFGLDGNVCDFLKAQKDVNKVSWLKTSLPRTINKYYRLAANDFPAFLKETGLGDQLPDIAQTNVRDDYPTACNRFSEVDLPPEQGDWRTFLPEKYVLFQPYSVQSCESFHHWPHWKGACDWLEGNFGIPVVMAGELTEDRQDWFPLGVGDKVVNIVGQTKCMTDLLHIADRAAMLVTTSNSLSVWSAARGIPALVVCNKIIKDRSPYYYEWICHGNNRVLDYDTTLDDFVSGLSPVMDLLRRHAAV